MDRPFQSWSFRKYLRIFSDVLINTLSFHNECQSHPCRLFSDQKDVLFVRDSINQRIRRHARSQPTFPTSTQHTIAVATTYGVQIIGRVTIDSMNMNVYLCNLQRLYVSDFFDYRYFLCVAPKAGCTSWLHVVRSQHLPLTLAHEVRCIL